MSCTTYRFENGYCDHVRAGGDHSAPVRPPSAAWSRLYGPSVVDMVIATTKAGFRAAARWRSERRAVEHLRSLSDHQLRDLGITRDQVMPVVLGQKTGPANASAE